MLMGDGNGALYFPGNGIADFARTGDGRKDDDMISNTDFSIRPLVTQEIHFSLPSTTSTEKPMEHAVKHVTQSFRTDT